MDHSVQCYVRLVKSQSDDGFRPRYLKVKLELVNCFLWKAPNQPVFLRSTANFFPNNNPDGLFENPQWIKEFRKTSKTLMKPLESYHYAAFAANFFQFHFTKKKKNKNTGEFSVNLDIITEIYFKKLKKFHAA